MSLQPDFTGEPPDHWWSDMDPLDLLAEISQLLGEHVGDVVEAWTEEPQGPAFARLEDGRVFRVTGDGAAYVWEEVVPA